MKVIIKDTAVEAKNIMGTWMISDADTNKIINQPKARRGRVVTKEKLVDLDVSCRVNDSLYYELIAKLDNCYHNNVIIGSKF